MNSRGTTPRRRNQSVDELSVRATNDFFGLKKKKMEMELPRLRRFLTLKKFTSIVLPLLIYIISVARLRNVLD
jgi:hypothetical protein